MASTRPHAHAPTQQPNPWLLAARPKTLPAAAAPVVLGTALAVAAGAFHAGAALAALVSALLIQVGTNYANDVADFEKGADTAARKGPTRAVAAGLVSVGAMKRATAVAFGLAFVVGLYLVVRGGWPILALGLAAIACGVGYTFGRYALAYTGLADLFVLVFFGPVAVGGTYYVQALALDAVAVGAGLGPGLLSTAILLANNIRDVDEDRQAGKRTLVVRLGRGFGVGFYVACFIGAAAVPFVLVFWTGAHFLACAAAVVVLPGLRNAHLLRHERDARALNPLLGATARLLLVYCLLFAAGWLIPL